MTERDSTYELRHEVAVVLFGSYAGQSYSSPEIHDRSGGRTTDTLVRRVQRLSRARALGCPVCACPLVKRFGEVNRWHFAEAPWASPDDREGHASHEPESAAHRGAKKALARALREILGPTWEVRMEASLETRQRADVLALHTSGTRVAFEVQLAPISPDTWRRRHDQYARIGVSDYWFMGAADLRRTRHTLADLLAAANGQRLMYISGEEAEVVEKVCEDPAVRPGESEMSPPYRTVVYAADKLQLSSEGALSTPADAEQSERMAVLEQRLAARGYTARSPSASPRSRIASEEPSWAMYGQRGDEGDRAPQPIPTQPSERALKEAPAWALRMQRERTRIARRMAVEEADARADQ